VEFVVDLDSGLRVRTYIHIYTHAYIHIHAIDSIWRHNLTVMPLSVFYLPTDAQ